MGRNYFSKYGGPCFINDGFSRHEHDHKPGETNEDIKPSPNLFYGLTIGFVSFILVIGTLLVVLN
jgi:hypothetical protein